VGCIATHANGEKVVTCSREMAILSQKDKKTTLNKIINQKMKNNKHNF
jgi:hypothetical protein